MGMDQHQMTAGPEAAAAPRRETLGPPPPPPPPPVYVTAEPAKKDHLLRDGWLLVVVGLLIPPLEIGAVVIGAILAGRGRVTTGVAMILCAVAIFAVRAALYFG
jgi:hypothetical protein